MPGPGRYGVELYPVVLMLLLRAAGLQIFQHHLSEVVLAAVGIRLVDG